MSNTIQDDVGGAQDAVSVSSSYVGDVDERTDDMPQPKTITSSSMHTEATSNLSASGVTNTSAIAASSDITLPSSENPLAESNIPGESFLKMGSLMQSHLVEDGEQGSKRVEGVTEQDDHDDFLDEILDDNLIVAAGAKETVIKPAPATQDEHDDFLDSVLDDDGDDNVGVNHDHLIDHDDALLDSMLGDDDDEVEEAMPPPSQKADEYVPDESIRKLEALLDEGLAGHNPLVEAVGKEDEPHTVGLEQNDDMAHALDALLDGALEEEVKFDDETPLPAVAIKKAEGPVKVAGVQSRTKTRTKVTPASDSKKRTPGVTRFFKSRTGSETKIDNTPPRESSKKKPMFGSETAQRASNSIRRSITARSRKVPKQIDKSPVNPPKVSPLKGPKSSPTRFISMKRFMSPTFASKRRFNEAGEELPGHSHDRFSTPKYSAPKSSWRSPGRSFMSSTLSSLKKMRSTSPDTEEKRRRERRRSGDVIKEDGTKMRLSGAFMEPTFAKTMLETETRIQEERKALEREEEAKKIVVKLSWDEETKPSPLIDYSKSPPTHLSPKLQTPRRASGETSKPTTVRTSRLIWTPKGLAPGTARNEAKENETATPMKHTPESVFSPRSLGSLSSMCSIHSFVSPKKAGIRGCQSKYNPTLHKFKAPCELCLFRLSDEEKDELDAHGRHFMVQFTTGGCPDCKAFPTSFEEPPVRLCMKCFAASHRPEKKRMRKKGNDAAIKGYSFAKTDYV